jgi:hypothetical protein
MFEISPTLILVAVGLLIALFLMQPLLLKASCSLCGEKPLGYGAGFLAILMSLMVGGVASTIYGFTLGAVLGAFSAALAGLGALVVSFGVTSVVYSAFLRVSVLRGAGVAVVHHVLSIGVIAIVGLALRIAAGLFA